MVDAFVSFAVEKLGNFLIQEVALRRSLRENVQWLRNELLFMQSFFKDAEEKQVEDLRVQQWIFEISSIANDTVAILETYSSNVAGKGSTDHGFASRLKSCACICRKETKLYNVGKEIQSLKKRIMDISRKRETYGIRNINIIAGEGPSNRSNNRSALIRTLRRTTSYADDQDQIFVGFQEVIERFLAELLKEEPRQSVISIYGMGGIGKTTLARNLYNSPSLITSFPTRAWICVSQEFNTPDLLRNIIKSIQGCTKEILDLLEKMTERDLESYLRDLLKERKYLLVVDDVWHKEAWESLKRAFPDSKKGCRVIITTRKEDVAESADNKGFAYKLRFLGQEESWDLFCKKLRRVDKFDNIGWSPAMERIASEMVERCGGLPLAIVVLSGLLSHKKGLVEWKKVKAHLWRHMQNNSIEISHILSLSYNDLSTELKQCFLYFGIFPEDSVINTEKLMCLWMAEGFIPRVGERMEDVAEDFLNELVRRSLIQVAKTFWEKIIGCRIHDLLRDLAVKKATEVNLFDIYDPRKHSVPLSRHRHAIHAQAQRYLSLDFSTLKLRTLLFFDVEIGSQDSKKFTSYCNMFQHLYVLDLERIRFTQPALPDAIGNLVHLKFLGLLGANDFKLPPSIGKLKNLQTLQVLNPDRSSCILPPQMSNLINLRHLIARYEGAVQLSKLTSLQTLKYIRCDRLKYDDAVGLLNLQELVMEKVMNSYSLNVIGSLKSLRTLILGCEYGEPFPPLEPLSSCQNLNKLWLHGKIEKLPLSDQLPKSITMMVLWSSRLVEDPMPILGMLSNLRNLDLVDAYEGKEITCNDDSFGQLEFLRLSKLRGLERWHLAATAMPLIKGFGILGCSKLQEIPKRMKRVALLEIMKMETEARYRFPGFYI
ncbi:disease resistance protein RPP13-like [Nicotiana tomentosiformis]|uniref:disease resistance protein RPP13-like n=1 Tax=Nicotiana tomentosiformis TaxID=4098 RepID=UPI00051BF5DF